jgi:hypothetical protein
MERGGLIPSCKFRKNKMYQLLILSISQKLALTTLYGKLNIRQSTDECLRLMYKATAYASEDFNEPPYTFALMLSNDYSGADIPQ